MMSEQPDACDRCGRVDVPLTPYLMMYGEQWMVCDPCAQEMDSDGKHNRQIWRERCSED